MIKLSGKAEHFKTDFKTEVKTKLRF